jgi:hypothetical protein
MQIRVTVFQEREGLQTVPSQSDPPVLLLLVWRFVFPSNKQKEL